MRWRRAKQPLIAAIIIFLIALGIEGYLGLQQSKQWDELKSTLNEIQNSNSRTNQNIQDLINEIKQDREARNATNQSNPITTK